MKISIFLPQSTFNSSQLQQLNALGEVSFVPNSELQSVDELKKFASGSEVIAVDPDAFGGFEKAKPILTQVMESLPNLKGVCLSTTSFGWIDVDYCKSRNISITNVPGYSRESVAEHAIALLLCLAKRIIITDRRTQKGQYKMEMGFELKGKTLGVIGLGSIGSRIAELGLSIGMKVIAYNRSPKTMVGVEMKTLAEVISQSDAISLSTTHEPANDGMIGSNEISSMKDGVIIVNTVTRELIDEEALAIALKSGKVYGYALETEDLEHGPLVGVENAILLKGFGWYTKEALENLWQMWADNITAVAQGAPQNRIA